MLDFCSGARARSAFLLKVTVFANRHADQQIFPISALQKVLQKRRKPPNQTVKPSWENLISQAGATSTSFPKLKG